MLANELRKLLKEGAMSKYSNLYSDVSEQTERFLRAIDAFEEKFGKDRDVYLLSVPGRSEIIGNHTDHNRGMVLAGAIDRDIIAVASKNGESRINLVSEGFEPDGVDLCDIDDPDNFKNYSSASLIAGLAKGFKNEGYGIGGFDAYTTTQVLKGSGISSSAAFEVMVGNILNHLYNDGRVDNKEIAKLSQFSENKYFGKPSGLMDQMACAVGGFVFIDFADAKNPTVEPIDFSLRRAGYSLCIVNTGGNHADLNDDYASVPSEMRAVAKELSAEVLSGITEESLVWKIPELRERVGDRAILRSLHFVRENKRVIKAKEALLSGDVAAFLKTVSESGRSSFEYLQNVYTVKNVAEQGLSLALALTDGYLDPSESAHRVHGGGFAGTIQVFVKTEKLPDYVSYIDGVLGSGSAMALNIRPKGAVKLF
jgi:galactokinase